MDTITFMKIENKIYPEKQLVGTFFLSDQMLITPYFEVRKLTVHDLVMALARNNARIAYWWFLCRCYKAGFIDKPMNEAFSWRHHWRWGFWKPRRWGRN